MASNFVRSTFLWVDSQIFFKFSYLFQFRKFLCEFLHVNSNCTYRQITCCSCTPQWWGSLYCFSIKSDGARLLHTGRAPVHQVLHHLLVPVPAGQDQGGGAIGLGSHQLGHFFFRPVVQEHLEIRRINTINTLIHKNQYK